MLRNLQKSDETYAAKSGNFWKLAFDASNRVVESVYVMIKSKRAVDDLNDLRFFKRAIVPTNVACLTDSQTALSDFRDWAHKNLKIH